MLIANPFASSLFLPTFWVVCALLGGIFVALLGVTRFDLARLRASSLFTRWRVWAIIAPVYGLAVLSGSLIFAVLVASIVFQGLREYAQLVGLPDRYRRVLLIFGLLPAPIALVSQTAFYTLIPTFLLLATLQPLLARQRDMAGHACYCGLRG